MRRSFILATAVLAVFGLSDWESSWGQGAGEKKPVAAPELLRLGPQAVESTDFAFSPDNKLFAYNWNGDVHIYDLQAKKEIHVLKDRPKGTWPKRLFFSPTSRELLVTYETSEQRGLWLWDMTTGKMLRSLEFDPPKDRLEMYDIPLAFSPDGKAAIGVLQLGEKWASHWDLATGKKIHVPGWESDRVRGGVRAFRFSDDGRTVVAEHWRHIRTEKNARFIFNIYLRLWEFASGRDLGPIGPVVEVTFKGIGAKMSEGSFPPGARLRQVGLAGHGCRVRMSSLGKVMVFPRDPQSTILEIKGQPGRLFDLATGKELPRAEQLNEFALVWVIALSPNSSRLAVLGEPKGDTSGSHKPMILLLDMSPWRDDALNARKEPMAEELTALWDDLGAEERIKALQALRRLRSSPQHALAFLKEQLRPVAYDTKKIPTYIAQIDDKNFKVREHAEAELILMGEHAEAAIKKALNNPTSLEARARLQSIVDMLEKGNWPAPPTRRLLWSIEFLELDASAPAVDLLELLATGPSEAWVTQEAVASLQRLGKGTGKKK